MCSGVKCSDGEVVRVIPVVIVCMVGRGRGLLSSSYQSCNRTRVRIVFFLLRIFLPAFYLPLP